MLILGFLTGLLTTIFVLVAIFLVLVILIQKPKGGGLSAAFGGGGGSQAVFGAKTGDVLTMVTVVTFILFLLLGIILVLRTDPAVVSPTDETVTEETTPLTDENEADPDAGVLPESDSTDEPAPVIEEITPPASETLPEDGAIESPATEESDDTDGEGNDSPEPNGAGT